MTTAPESLKTDVTAAIEAVATIPGPNEPATTLASRGVTGLAAGTLAAPFQRIARSFKSDAKIGRAQCENLETFGDAITLVTKAAGF